MIGIALAFMWSAVCLYASDEGYAMVSADQGLGPAMVALDEKIVASSYPLNSKLVIRNVATGVDTEVTVVKSISNTNVLAYISKDLANVIGIQDIGGRIMLLTLPEAEAFSTAINSSASQKLANQEPDTLPEKPSGSSDSSASSTGKALPVQPQTGTSQTSDPTPAQTNTQPVPKASQTAPPAEPVQEPVKTAEVTENAGQPPPQPAASGETDKPEARMPEERASRIAQNTRPVTIKEEPLLPTASAAPETHLPGATPAASLKGKDTPDIREEPSIEKVITPEINLPPGTSMLAKGHDPRRSDAAPEINDKPVAYIETVNQPEINLPAGTSRAGKNADRGSQTDESLVVNDKPVAQEESGPPEISLPAEIPTIAKTPESSRIDTAVIANDKPVAQEESAGPEINLPPEIPTTAKSPSIARNDIPAVTDRSLPPERPQNWDDYTLSLVPAEKRPPAERSTPGLPLDAEVPPITRNTSLSPTIAQLPSEAEIAPIRRTPPAAQPAAPARLPSEAEIPPISRNPGPSSSRAGLPPEAEIPPITRNTGVSPSIAGLPPEAEVAPITRNTPVSAPAQRVQREPDPFSIMTGTPAESGTVSNANPPVFMPGPQFSVPLISNLEKGKYYLQLAALSKSELVESELSKIGKSYPLTVQTIGNQDRPMYRILLGPINPGESGALLQRFKGIGYKDAFIRQGS
jgi:hypothetical protein